VHDRREIVERGAGQMRRYHGVIQFEQWTSNRRLRANASMPAPNSRSAFKASANAASSTSPPRAQLINTARVHRGNALRVHDIRGLRHQRQMQRDNVSLAHQRVEVEVGNAEALLDSVSARIGS